MTSGVLRYTLVVRHPETGEATPLRGGERVPTWAADLVHADDVESDALEKPKPAKKATAKRSSSN